MVFCLFALTVKKSVTLKVIGIDLKIIYAGMLMSISVTVSVLIACESFIRNFVKNQTRVHLFEQNET
ncbi:MAG: hypothetical protein D3909_07835 [Candidatus Electrothrix sp. ATG1]|nr:hypothetical protein [Candidatus Electrothrix sp. ATG1]